MMSDDVPDDRDDSVCVHGGTPPSLLSDDHVSPSSAQKSSESLKLELEETQPSISVHDPLEAHLKPLPCKRNVLTSGTEIEPIKRRKLFEEDCRRQSIEIIKVIPYEETNFERSVIDLLCDKESSINERDSDVKETSVHEVIKKDNENVNDQSGNVSAHDSTPKINVPKRVVSSVEFNEKETLSSTPESCVNDLVETDKSEVPTETLQKETYYVQISCLSILKQLPTTEGIESIFKSDRLLDPNVLQDILGLEKLDIKDVLLLRKARLSDGSSLSVASSFKTISTGYSADNSSAGSSEGLKRDRLSIAPEATISPHRVIAKLPSIKKLSKSILEDLSSLTSPCQSVIQEPSCSLPLRKKVLKKKKPKEVNTKKEHDNLLKPDYKYDSQIAPGLKVFAKWIEGSHKKIIRYYLAKVISENPDKNKWKLLFDDGCERELREEDILPANSLAPGMKINVEVEENIFRSAIILSHPIPGNSGIEYPIEFEKKDEFPLEESCLIKLNQIHLNAEQACEVIRDIRGPMAFNSPSVTGGDLNLNNIVTSKRTRSGKLSETPDKSRKRGGRYIDTSVAEVSSSDTPKSSQSRRNKSMNKSISSLVTTSTEDDAKECTSSIKKKRGRPKKINDEAQLFSGMNFILTKTLNKHPEGHIETESDYDSSSSSSAEEKEAIIESSNAFSKKLIRSLILEHGGVVFEEFPGENIKFPRKCEEFYILSNQSCRTMNFLYGIAHGITRISFQWVIDSVREKKKFPVINYLLPMGYSEVKGIELEQRSIDLEPRTYLFKNTYVLVFGKDLKVVEDWKILLLKLGSKVSVHVEGDSPLKISLLSKAHVGLYVGEEKSVYLSVLEVIRSASLLVVTPHWVIESLINGVKLDYHHFIFE